MRVALRSTSLLSPFTGIAQYVRSLALELQGIEDVDLRLFYAGYWGRHVRSMPMQGVAESKKAIRRLFPRPYELFRKVEQIGFSLGTSVFRPDIYHEPAFLPLRHSGPTVVTAHDLSWIRFPETHPHGRVAIMNQYFPRALQSAAHVITDAEFTRREIAIEFGVSMERITAVPLGARDIFQPRDSQACEAVLVPKGLAYRSYILCVGTLEPRKNLGLVIHAYSSMPEAYRSRRPLVIVGMRGWLTSGLEEMMQPLVASGQIRILGYASETDLAALYAGAHVLVYPSLYEGFGLPPLEAMASGTPVIVSNRSTLPEVVGTAGIQIEATDVAGLVEAMNELDQDPEAWQARAQASLARAASFSWRRCAEETLAVYRKVLAPS